MFNEYKSYENWNPKHREMKQFEKGESEEFIKTMTAKLLERSKKQQY